RLPFVLGALLEGDAVVPRQRAGRTFVHDPRRLHRPRDTRRDERDRWCDRDRLVFRRAVTPGEDRNQRNNQNDGGEVRGDEPDAPTTAPPTRVTTRRQRRERRRDRLVDSGSLADQFLGDGKRSRRLGPCVFDPTFERTGAQQLRARVELLAQDPETRG